MNSYYKKNQAMEDYLLTENLHITGEGLVIKYFFGVFSERNIMFCLIVTYCRNKNTLHKIKVDFAGKKRDFHHTRRGSDFEVGIRYLYQKIAKSSS